MRWLSPPSAGGERDAPAASHAAGLASGRRRAAVARSTTTIYLESGKKRVFACALEWPGWCRSGRDEERAIEALAAYAPRYAVVTRHAGMRFRQRGHVFEVVERLAGGGVTDFGALGKPALKADFETVSANEAQRLARLLEAAWATLDEAVARSPSTLAKGPRGGGRDRDPMLQHVLSAEASYARTIGVRVREPHVGDRESIEAARGAIIEVVRGEREGERTRGKGWPLRYFVRRAAWHALDHAWEMEDKGHPAA
jgi:hypothetical protein